ncbi:MAG: NADH:ubiquinone oxidoreductase subunit K [Roseivirga sp.]|jgi:NADH:ubiquinone oxidoreductase subunit K
MKSKWPLVVLCLILASQSAFSQTYLVARKKGSSRKYEYFVGSQIVYRQKGYDVFFEDRIAEFADSTLILNDNIILLSQIEEIDIRNASTNRAPILRSIESILPSIGIGLMAIDIFNHTIVDGQDFSLDQSTTATATTLISVGYAMKIMRRKKLDLTNPKFEIYIIGL